MDTVDFLKEWRRICQNNTTGCGYCYLRDACGKGNSIDEYSNDEIELITSLVKGRPIKTRQSEFLKMFPNASVKDDDGALYIFPCKIDKTIASAACSGNCTQCRLDYWLQEVEADTAYVEVRDD